METTSVPNSDRVKDSKGSSRVVLGLLGVIVLIIGGVAYFGWETSALRGALQPQQHARSKAKEELGKRFQEGVVMLHAKQYEHALTAFHRVLQLDPQMPEAYVNAGYALLGLGDAKAAADFFDSATVLRPNQFNAYFGLGEALQTMGDNRAALQAMETYMHLSPADDPFRRKAEAAIWELRAELEKSGPPPQGTVPHRRRGEKP